MSDTEVKERRDIRNRREVLDRIDHLRRRYEETHREDYRSHAFASELDDFRRDADRGEDNHDTLD